MNKCLASTMLITLLLLGGCVSQQYESGGAQEGHLRGELQKADQALQEARLTDAEIIYRRLTKSHPDLPDVWLRLGNIYARQGRNEAAVHTYLNGIKYQRDDARLWYNLSVVQMKQAIMTLEDASMVLDEGSPQLTRIRRLHDALLDINNMNSRSNTNSYEE